MGKCKLNEWPVLQIANSLMTVRKVSGSSLYRGYFHERRRLLFFALKPACRDTTTLGTLVSLGLLIKAADRKGSACDADDQPAITNLQRTYPAANPALSTGVSTGSFRSLRSE